MAIPEVTIVRGDGNITPISTLTDGVYGLIVGATSAEGWDKDRYGGDDVNVKPLLISSAEDLIGFGADAKFEHKTKTAAVAAADDGKVVLSGTSNAYLQISEYYRVAEVRKPLWVVVLDSGSDDDRPTFESIFGTAKDSPASVLMAKSAESDSPLFGIFIDWEDQKNSESGTNRPLTDAVGGFAGGIVNGCSVADTFCSFQQSEYQRGIFCYVAGNNVGDTLSDLNDWAGGDVVDKSYVACFIGRFGVDERVPIGFLGGWYARDELRVSRSAADVQLGSLPVPVGAMPYIGSSLYGDLSKSEVDLLSDKRYNFFRRVPVQSGLYISQDNTLHATSDYRTVALNRVVSKVERIIVEVLSSYLNSEVELDTAGDLSLEFVKGIESQVGGRINREMTAVGELVGATVFIPIDADILRTRSIEVQYTLIPVGTVEKITNRINYSLGDQ